MQTSKPQTKNKCDDKLNNMTASSFIEFLKKRNHNKLLILNLNLAKQKNVVATLFLKQLSNTTFQIIVTSKLDSKLDNLADKMDTRYYLYQSLNSIIEFKNSENYNDMCIASFKRTGSSVYEVFLHINEFPEYSEYLESLKSVNSGGKPSAKWVVVKGRKATLKDGTKKAIYHNAATGEFRIKKMVIRKGIRVASYVKF